MGGSREAVAFRDGCYLHRAIAHGKSVFDGDMRRFHDGSWLRQRSHHTDDHSMLGKLRSYGNTEFLNGTRLQANGTNFLEDITAPKYAEKENIERRTRRENGRNPTDWHS
jgi:hypothetical protein